MKKLLVIGMILAMVSGCAAIQSFLSSPAINFFCAPSDEQKAEAALMLAALDAAQAVGTVFYPVLGIAKASAVLTTIKNGGCFIVDQLKEAFAAVDAANAQIAQAQLKKMPDMAVPALPEYPALRKLVK